MDRMTPLERAARAVKDASTFPGAKPTAGLSDVDLRVARAVIEAIREPDEAMIEAGDELAGTINPADSYQTMIDAILSDTAPE